MGDSSFIRILKLLVVNLGVTGSRVFSAGYIAYMAYQPGSINLSILLIGIYGGLSDFLDGLLARWWRVETKTGALLDKGADKIFIAVIAVTLYCCSPLWQRGLSWWENIWGSQTGKQLVILVGQELALSVFGILLAALRETRREANIFGKAKMWAECASLLPWTWWLLKDPSGTVFLKNINTINFLLFVANTLAFISFLCYLYDHLKKTK